MCSLYAWSTPHCYHADHCVGRSFNECRNAFLALLPHPPQPAYSGALRYEPQASGPRKRSWTTDEPQLAHAVVRAIQPRPGPNGDPPVHYQSRPEGHQPAKRGRPRKQVTTTNTVAQGTTAYQQIHPRSNVGGLGTPVAFMTEHMEHAAPASDPTPKTRGSTDSPSVRKRGRPRKATQGPLVCYTRGVPHLRILTSSRLRRVRKGRAHLLDTLLYHPKEHQLYKAPPWLRTSVASALFRGMLVPL